MAGVAGLGHQKVVPGGDHRVLADPHDHPALVDQAQDQASAFAAHRAQRPATTQATARPSSVTT